MKYVKISAKRAHPWLIFLNFVLLNSSNEMRIMTNSYANNCHSIVCYFPILVSSYRLGTVNSNTVNSKFHLIQSFFDFLARFLSSHV